MKTFRERDSTYITDCGYNEIRTLESDSAGYKYRQESNQPTAGYLLSFLNSKVESATKGIYAECSPVTMAHSLWQFGTVLNRLQIEDSLGKPNQVLLVGRIGIDSWSSLQSSFLSSSICAVRCSRRVVCRSVSATPASRETNISNMTFTVKDRQKSLSAVKLVFYF